MNSTVIPCMRYKDAPKAIDWLCQAFGFERHLVVDGENGTIAHAQLKHGTGMIMLGSDGGESEFDKWMRTPSDVGGLCTQSPYIYVADADAHCAQAKAGGAEILMEIADQDYGGRVYSCRDLEGHVWSFGSYNPWA